MPETNDHMTCPNCGAPKEYSMPEPASDDSYIRRAWHCDDCGAYGDEYYVFQDDEWSIDAN